MAGTDAGLVSTLRRELLRGLVIPAHPLALTERRTLDERRQVALTRHYCDAGAGGIAGGRETQQVPDTMQRCSASPLSATPIIATHSIPADASRMSSRSSGSTCSPPW